MKKVLFVCVGNKFRSQLSAAFFNKFVDPKKAMAESAGTEPGENIPENVIKVAAEYGLDISKNKPRALTEEMYAHFDKIITVCSLTTCPPVHNHKVETWEIPDTTPDDIGRIKEIAKMIEAKVREFSKQFS